MNRSRSRSSRSRTRPRSRIFTVKNFLAAIAVLLILWFVTYFTWYIFHETDKGREVLISMGFKLSPSQKMREDEAQRKEFEEKRREEERERNKKPTFNPNFDKSFQANYGTPTGKEVTIHGVKMDCAYLKPCKDLPVKPEGGCCPGGIEGKDITGECRVYPERIAAMRECGYSV